LFPPVFGAGVVMALVGFLVESLDDSADAQRESFGRLRVVLIVILALGLVAIILLPKLAHVHQATKRMLCASRLRQVGIAMHNYHKDHGHLPPAVVYGKDGQPLYSWRVVLLPYLEEGQLYKEFRLEEAWDSPHNGALLARMPKVYAPADDVKTEPYTTFCQVFVGEGAAFEHNRKVTLEEIKEGDGLACTILAVEAGEAVPWTKPVDLPFGADKPLPLLGGLFQEGRTVFYTKRMVGYNALFVDGGVLFISKQIKQDTLRALIARNGGERVDPDQLD
jgi:hypothetical protein